MGRTHDALGLVADRSLQLATLHSGWRFYERAAKRDDAQQALMEWVDAVDAVLELGVEPSALLAFKPCLTIALSAAEDGQLQQEIRTLIAAVEPSPLGDRHDLMVSLRALKEKTKKGHTVATSSESDAVATDTGVHRRSAVRVSSQL